MSNTNLPATAPLFYFNGYKIEASYSLSTEGKNSGGKKSNKVWLDMEFKHPIKDEAVTVRSAKSGLILSQPKEVIEAIAQRDIRTFLTFSHLSLASVTN